MPLNLPSPHRSAIPSPPCQAMLADLTKNVPGADSVIFSTHCQNDLGLSTANSIAGERHGAALAWRGMFA